MKELYHVYNYRFISIKDTRLYKELDITKSLHGEYKVLHYPLTTPSVKLCIKFIK